MVRIPLLYSQSNTLKQLSQPFSSFRSHRGHISTVPPVLDGALRESLNYTLGSHVALLCEASGVPVPSITWLKDGTPIGKREAVTRELEQYACHV